MFFVVKWEVTNSDLNRIFKISKIFKEWLYQFHSPSEFPWPSGDLNLILQNPRVSLYPLHHTGNHYSRIHGEIASQGT